MAQNFSPGQFCGATWSPVGGAPGTLEIRGHTLDLSVMLFDVSNTGNPTGRARLAGLDDVAGTVNTFLDLDLPLYSAIVVIVPASRGIASFGMSLVRGIQTPVIVEKLHFQVTTDTALEASFDVKMDCRVGLIVYPPI